MAYKLEWEEEGVVNTFTDIHSLEEDNEAVVEIFHDPRIKSVKYIIWDLIKVRGTTMKAVQNEFHSRIVEIHANELGSIKVAFVTDDEEMKNLCISYIHNALANGSKWIFHISRTLKEARKWISQ